MRVVLRDVVEGTDGATVRSRRTWRGESQSALTRPFAIGVTVFVAGSIALVWNLGKASPVIEWMNIFRISDFQSVADALPFIANLRVPIPPNLAVIEIVDYRLTGSTWISTVLLYKLYVVVAYTCVVVLAYPSRLRLVASGVLGWLFIFATTRIHPGNPMLYDVAAPAFFMVFVLLLRIGTSPSIGPRISAAALAGSGLFLTMFELTRPFVILLLPAILLLAGVRIGLRRRLLYFAVPVVLVSGTWHVHQAVAHRQLAASNHFGVNLWRCWNSKVPPLAKPVREDDAPLSEGRWPNLNNPQHLKNSLRLRKKIMRYIVAHPADSIAFMLHRLRVFTKGETAIYGHKPQHRLLVWCSPLSG